MTMASEAVLNRLVYLLVQHKVQIPKVLWPYLPWGEWLGKLHRGPGATDVGLEQTQYLFEKGARLGSGSREEAIAIITKVVDSSLSTATTITPEQRLKAYMALNNLPNSQMIDKAEGLLTELVDGPSEEMPKFSSGFEPLDRTLQGLYQGLLVLMGKPGTGKTSLMLSLMESLVQNRLGSVLFVENEIPFPMMKFRISSMRKRGLIFGPSDRLICASWSAAQVLEWIQENPDPNRVVFFDSPDVVTSGGFDDRRSSLEDSYQDLIRIKMGSKLVVVSSQSRRKDTQLAIESVAESWAKAWYADMIVSISTAGKERVKLSTLKNRFGPHDGSVTFSYSYADLSWGGTEEAGVEDW